MTDETLSIELVRPGEPPLTGEFEVSAAKGDERLVAPPTARERRARAVSLAFAVVGAILIHATVVAVLVTQLGFKPVEPPPEPIPVEIITEPPPPPPPPPPPTTQQQEPPQALDDEPAHDAAKAHQKAETERDGTSQTASAPKPAEAKDPAPPPPPQAAAPPLVEAKDADEPAMPKPAPTPDGSAATPAPQTDANAAPALPLLLAMPAFTAAPTFSMPAASPFESVFVGKAKATYFSAEQPRVMAHMPVHDGEPVTPEQVGEIAFVVDGHGRLIRRTLVRSSGNSATDQAALRAIEAASPYDPPPDHVPLDMVFNFPAH